MERNLLILYGSQTGYAEEVAERLVREARRRHFTSTLKSMQEYYDTSMDDFPQEPLVIFVASTTGQGDAPDNMTAFWRFLLQKGLAADSLEEVTYSVFGLGDSSYQKYNAVAKKLDKRLAQLGAQRFHPIGLGDDQHPLGLDGDLDPWVDSLFNKLLTMMPLPPGLEVISANTLPPARYKIAVQREAGSAALNTIEEFANHAATRPAPNPSGRHYQKWKPFLAPVKANSPLTPEARLAERNVRHLEFDISASQGQFTYNPGDVLSVMPRNPDDAVARVLEVFGLAATDVISSISPASSDVAPCPIPTPITASLLFTWFLDICCVPRRYFFELACFFTEDPVLKERLEYFCHDPEGREDLFFYCQREKRPLHEVFRDFPSVRPPLDYLLEMVPLLKPRQFSISSSLKAHPGAVHITVAVVRYTTPQKYSRVGLCSTWLDTVRPGMDVVPIWATSGTITLPEDPARTPMIMVGPGTGVAPFRAFLQEMDALGHRGLQCALFFGCRQENLDYLYRNEFEEYRKKGVLSHLITAFSRDQDNKVYVQHRIKEHGGEMARWITESENDNSIVYVAGSSVDMPTDVWNAFVEILAAHITRNSSDDDMDKAQAAKEATMYLRRMEAKRRYCAETWS